MAARNALTRSLRAGGDRDGAALVAALRRPSWTDWALNRAADVDPDAAAAFAGAADAMRDAQTAAVEGRHADVSAALRTLRDRSAALVKQANAALTGAGRAADVADLTERVAAIAADLRASEQLRAAVLRADDDAMDAIRGLPDPTTAAASSADPSPPRPAGGAARPGVRGRRAGGRIVDDTTEHATGHVAEQMVEQAAERRRAMRELAESERARRIAAHELARAERVVVEAEAKRASASEAVGHTQRELAETQARLSTATVRRATLAHEVDAAERRAAALRHQLDRLADD